MLPPRPTTTAVRFNHFLDFGRDVDAEVGGGGRVELYLLAIPLCARIIPRLRIEAPCKPIISPPVERML